MRNPTQYSPLARLLIIAGTFFCGLMLLSFLLASGITGNQETREGLLLTSVAQNILIFILPAFTAAWIQSARPMQFLSLTRPLTLKWIAIASMLYLVSMPAINWLADLNASMHLPESMVGFEATLRELEETAGKATDILLGGTSAETLITGILAVGILTGFSEEIFFRGAVQRTLRKCGAGGQAAVWISAILFSLMHFQMFGFVPRVMLGAMFGYVVLCSGSLWTSVYLHALNNSAVVFTTWMIKRGEWPESASELGASPLYGIISLILSGAIIYYIMRVLPKTDKRIAENG